VKRETQPSRSGYDFSLLTFYLSRFTFHVFKMKALVTGATGFVGGAVVRALVNRGIDVRILARAGADLQNTQNLPVERVLGDLRDQASLRTSLTGCRQLYHVAAHYALWAKDPSIFYDINVTGTKNLLEAARDVGTERIVYCSTIGAIGLPPGGGLGTEETPVSLKQMAGHYKRSKYLAEQEVLKLAKAGLPVVIVNPSAPVGAGDVKPTPTGQVIVDFMKGRMPAYIETGMNIVDVDDVAAGHLLAMEKGRIGERYILGNKNLMLREVFEILSRLTGIKAPTIKLPRLAILPLAYLNHRISNFTGQPPRIPLEGVKMAKYKMHYDCRKAIKELGIPQTPPEEALEKAVRWFRNHGYA
jgi:dihydroflavonol-4-reductase